MTDKWAQYPDSTTRETYPPAPTRGGEANKELSDAVGGMIVNQHGAAVRNEAAFRERQRVRRLQTRGAAAMRDPDMSLPIPPLDIPDDPALAEYKAAGWLS